MTIGIILNPQSPTTDVYRTVHPFSLLGHETLFIDPAAPKWADLNKCAILVVSRPNGLTIYNLLQEFKRMGQGKRVISDIDDNLHELDKANPSYPHFSQDAVKASVVDCLNLSDHVIFSTKALQDYYTQPRKVAHGTLTVPVPALVTTPSSVVPNAVDLNITPMKEPKPVHSPLRVLWRGSEHHKADLETIRPFWDVVLKDKSYEVMFMGLAPHDVHAYFPGAIPVPWQPSPFSFWKKLASLDADVGIFPLAPTLFNMGKSNNFALEMLVNGILPIVPAGFPEFEHPGVWQYGSIALMEMFAGGMQHLQKLVTTTIKDGQTWVLENRTLDKVNQERSRIIESL